MTTPPPNFVVFITLRCWNGFLCHCPHQRHGDQGAFPGPILLLLMPKRRRRWRHAGGPLVDDAGQVPAPVFSCTGCVYCCSSRGCRWPRKPQDRAAMDHTFCWINSWWLRSTYIFGNDVSLPLDVIAGPESSRPPVSPALLEFPSLGP